MAKSELWRRWLPPLFVLTAVLLLSSVLTASTVGVCHYMGFRSVFDILFLPVVMFIGFLFAFVVLLFLETVPLVFTVIGLSVLLGLMAVIVVSASRALRGDAKGHWPVIPTTIFLVATAALSAISTASGCVTATI